MKLCKKCLLELFDRDECCPQCGSDDLISNAMYTRIKADISNSTNRKLKSLLKQQDYLLVYNYIQHKNNQRKPIILELQDNDLEVCPTLYKTHTVPSSNTNAPKCPTCQSTNIRKMGSIERGASIFTWGIFSKKINKTFKCNSCGYTW